MKRETRGGKREGAKRPTLYAFKTKTISIRVTGRDFKMFATNEHYEAFFSRLKSSMQEKYKELLNEKEKDVVKLLKEVDKRLSASRKNTAGLSGVQSKLRELIYEAEKALPETKPLAEDLFPKYRKIPIIITKWNNGVKGWRAEIPDNYQNYKPARYSQINFEDLNYHFNHMIPVHAGDSLIFSTRKDAVEAAKYCNTRYLGGKAKIWFIT